jgi:LPXTG-site transpeptidase (sortase) family protein
LAGNETPRPDGGEDNELNKQTLADIQHFLLDDEPEAEPQSLTAARQLSLEQLEELLAQKRAEAARQKRSELRQGGLKAPVPAEQRSPTPGPSKKIVPAPSQTSVAANVKPNVVPPAERFTPPAALVSQPRKRRRGENKTLNAIGYTLEILVIIAALALFLNWALQQAGISIFNWFSPTSSINDWLVAPARPEGIVLKVNAPGVIRLPATPTPTATPRPTVTPVLGATPPVAVAPLPTPTPVIGLAAPVAVAPTPTPAIVQAVAQSIEQGAPLPPDPPRRLQVPKLGLDSPIREVTVNLGTWQVADYAVGHHQGTGLPGKPGNLVLAGHRDVRGSIFLRLNELARGDEFSVVADRSVYRYQVTDVYEVLPTEVAVMAPTLDATATLITCTPIGLATKRLIVKARLL